MEAEADKLPAFLPLDVQYWIRPWSAEEVQHILKTIGMLRLKEENVQLGQGPSIDELELRVRKVASLHQGMAAMTL